MSAWTDEQLDAGLREWRHWSRIPYGSYDEAVAVVTDDAEALQLNRSAMRRVLAAAQKGGVMQEDVMAVIERPIYVCRREGCVNYGEPGRGVCSDRGHQEPELYVPAPAYRGAVEARDALAEAGNKVVMAFLTGGPLTRRDVEPLVTALDRFGGQ